MMNPHPDLDKPERYPRKPSHAILISLTVPEDHSLSGGSRGKILMVIFRIVGVMSNLTRFTLRVLAHGGATSMQPWPSLSFDDRDYSSRLRCCYSKFELWPNMARKSAHSQISEPLHRSRGMVSDSRAERGMAQRPRIVVYLHPSGTKP